ncbi:hypothetical protein MPL3356_60543 [Mesorhizobium plurifarium]|uniref:Uncharacterized protein n=1 Tax=Mesorhizobium plurifarium TaxID=69974 RepID=A0A090G705_MESPL|nr:hypothetical protein MPL3356_60543 [Mesorhizobium plurifarium]
MLAKSIFTPSTVANAIFSSFDASEGKGDREHIATGALGLRAISGGRYRLRQRLGRLPPIELGTQNGEQRNGRPGRQDTAVNAMSN